MRFTKMQGAGNDYVYVNCFREKIERPSEAAVRISDRHFGIGSDGLILIGPSDRADFRMEMYNADGSKGAMCGNGIRCVAKYVYDYGLTDKTSILVETGSGLRELDMTVEGGKVRQVRVDMGTPDLDPRSLPAKLGTDGAPVIGAPLTVAERTCPVTLVSMGNPHCVTPVSDLDALDIERIGPAFENHPCFPNRVNTEFVEIPDRKTIRMRVWERGSGETLACGTGACAAAVAGVLNGWTDSEVTVKLLGGDLRIFWDREHGTVFMTGPAETVFEGEIDLEA